MKKLFYYPIDSQGSNFKYVPRGTYLKMLLSTCFCFGYMAGFLMGCVAGFLIVSFGV